MQCVLRSATCKVLLFQSNFLSSGMKVFFPYLMSSIVIMKPSVWTLFFHQLRLSVGLQQVGPYQQSWGSNKPAPINSPVLEPRLMWRAWLRGYPHEVVYYDIKRLLNTHLAMWCSNNLSFSFSHRDILPPFCNLKQYIGMIWNNT